MRALRLLGDGRSFYHCVSRVVDKRKVFEARDKEVFRKIMRNLEAFMGVRVVTYCFMSNHFHLLIEVPDREELTPLSEASLLELLPRIQNPVAVEGVRQEFYRARAAGSAEWHARILARYEKRRGSLSFFLKDLKQRMTYYMNQRLERTGTLWEGRFKSVLVEGSELALLTIAAYIDLNPVRAGLVKKPEDYRWSGYAEALSGTRGAKMARQGLGLILSEAFGEREYKADWRRTQNRYRMFLYSEGEERTADEQSGAEGRIGFSESEVKEVEDSKGEIPIREIIRHRVRYFCDCAILGSTEFVNGIFAREKAEGRASPKRTTGARKMRGADWGELRTLRDLRKDVFG